MYKEEEPKKNQEIEPENNEKWRLTVRHGRVVLLFGKGGEVVIQGL